MSEFCALAVAQTCPLRGDIEANLAEHLQLLRIAARAGAQLVLFPELSLSGYEPELAPDLAFTDDDPRLTPLMDAAAALAVIALVGAPVRLGAQLHIGAFIIYPDRRLELYTKHRLGAFSAQAACDGTVPPAEATVFHPATRNPLIHCGGGTAAVAICADTGNPMHPRQAAARGADVYLASMFVIPSEFAGDAATLQAYAAQYSMVVALANFGGPSGGLAAAGRSSVWSRTGELLIQLPARGAGVALAVPNADTWRTQALMLSDVGAAPAA